MRVIVRQEGDTWIAQCIEHDIGAQAGDVVTLLWRLRAALRAEERESMARYGVAFAGIDPAPQHYADQGQRDRRTLP